MLEPPAPLDTIRLCHGVPLAHAVRTDVGRVRSNNEDAFGARFLDEGSLLLVVADGMGGHEAGEVASALAVEVVDDVVSGQLDQGPQPALYQALVQANQAIIAEARRQSKHGMGTTAVVALVRGREVFAGLVGDSRLYHIRRGQIIERTVDHTRVQTLLDRGMITQEEARDHPDSGMLTRALGHARMSNGQPLEPEVFADPLRLEDGDAIVMSTDGLHDLVEDWEVAALIAGQTALDASEALVDLALDRGGHDNVTVAVVAVGGRVSGYDVPDEPVTGPVYGGAASTAPIHEPLPLEHPGGPAPMSGASNAVDDEVDLDAQYAAADGWMLALALTAGVLIFLVIVMATFAFFLAVV